MDDSDRAWRRSSYSSQEGGNCVEVAAGPRTEAIVPIRDSKVPHGPMLRFDAVSWSAFIGELKRCPPHRPTGSPAPCPQGSGGPRSRA
ncbi:DUF397 domain-containing protein [Streptomyces antibioticus]|uniref:DUF397 domain-containing protein n=1 Tax=Streptomyces antibioticus TaxID=1890 RepID=UPI0033F4040D